MDPEGIAKRLKLLRKHSGLSREAFGSLFRSKESTVYQWEQGSCVPRLVKLMNISQYFGVSLDCILCGRAVTGNMVEEMLCGTAKPFHNLEKMMRQYRSLSSRHRERLSGYLDALCREKDMDQNKKGL